MKINNLHLQNQDQQNLELVLSEINTAQTIFKNRVNFIALSENQGLILEIVRSVEEILDYSIFKTDLLYSLVYKEIINMSNDFNLTLVYTTLKDITNTIYSDKSHYPEGSLNNIYYYILYLKNVGVKRLEVIDFIDSLNLTEDGNLEGTYERGFARGMDDDFYFNDKKYSKKEVQKEVNIRKSRSHNHINKSIDKEFELKFWNEIISKLEDMNKRDFKYILKNDLIRECREIKSELKRGNGKEYELLKDKVLKKIRTESRKIERNFDNKKQKMSRSM